MIDFDLFKKEIISICRKHDVVIGHEDHQGGFIISNAEEMSEDRKKSYYNWFKDAATEE